MEVTYNCWHGCHKRSEGCLHCYVYRRDESVGRDASVVYKTKDFDLPLRRNRKGGYKYPAGTRFMMCFSSDFFIEEADEWRGDVLSMIRERNDCSFFCITKRPERIETCIGDLSLYPNLRISCTMENQRRFDERAPIYLGLPLGYREITIEPMLERVDMSAYIGMIDSVTVGGESGDDARLLDFEWVKDIREQCKKAQVAFYFHQTGARIKVDGKIYQIPRSKQHSQARKAFKDQ
jgi:protein gp37